MKKLLKHPISYGIVGATVYVFMEFLFRLKSGDAYPIEKIGLTFLVMGAVFTGVGYYNVYQKRKQQKKEAQKKEVSDRQ